MPVKPGQWPKTAGAPYSQPKRGTPIAKKAEMEARDDFFLERQTGFVRTPCIDRIVERCLRYLRSGLPVHLRGTAGTGKTALAFHLAEQLGRPSVFISGNEDLTPTDLVGDFLGFRRRLTIDQFIHSVTKREEDVARRWIDSRLTVALVKGYTLIYDEFTRSRPEANTILLSVLEERVLELPAGRGANRYLKAHPNFAAIFTSNPEEYAGVYKSQDALRDRMVTVDLEGYDLETEIAIVASRTGLAPADAEIIVRLVRTIRENGQFGVQPTIRGSLMIARTVKNAKTEPSMSNPVFREIMVDILFSELSRRDDIERPRLLNLLDTTLSAAERNGTEATGEM